MISIKSSFDFFDFSIDYEEQNKQPSWSTDETMRSWKIKLSKDDKSLFFDFFLSKDVDFDIDWILVCYMEDLKEGFTLFNQYCNTYGYSMENIPAYWKVHRMYLKFKRTFNYSDEEILDLYYKTQEAFDKM